MIIWLQGALIFFFSAGNDWLSVLWHRYREEGNPVMGSLVAVFLGLIGWLAIWWIVNDSIWLVGADLVGTAIGSYIAIEKEKKFREQNKAI